MSEAELPPGFYVHLPFCARICPYCDFAVTPVGHEPHRRHQRFGASLLKEFALRPAAQADTLYFGGGTPSLAAPALLSEWIEAAREAGHLRPDGSVFLEANPEDVDRERARAWAGAGVFGVSLGAQALDDQRLRFLGRQHHSGDIRSATGWLAEAGIRWISVDIIYGTRGQTEDGLTDELRQAAALPGINHLSAYQLTVEPNTPFARRRPRPTAGTPLFAAVHRALAAEGFAAYEVSNFARAPEHQSRHNRKYWLGAAYTGVGPSAHSFAPGEGRRWWNLREVGRWQHALEQGELPEAGSETLGPREQALEEVFLGLRTVAGLDLDRFRRRYGAVAVDANRERLSRWAARRLVRIEASRVRPTLAGLAVADGLAREFQLEGVPR